MRKFEVWIDNIVMIDWPNTRTYSWGSTITTKTKKRMNKIDCDAMLKKLHQDGDVADQFWEELEVKEVKE